MKKFLKVLLVIALVVVVSFFLLQLRALISQRALVNLLPQITAITLYDVHDPRADSNTLASAASVQFPVEAFRRACATAASESGVVLWKGSSLAIIELSDGSQLQARFSYYGGFFTIDGFSGHFVASGRGGSEFQRLHRQLIQEQFVPRRQERNKAVIPESN